MKTVILALVCLLHVDLSVPLFDGCSLVTMSHFDGPDAQTNITIPQNCTSGRIDWHYPQGKLHVQLSLPSLTYSLCLIEGWATMVAEVREVTGGVNKVLNLPTAGHPACTKAVGGTTELLVQADPMLAYMTSFNYTVVTKSQTH
ncbi:unnamed protein product [Lymnaea stagnalis]|uniref:Uncharacterized protein n=1 Tax=Lymnaea stagnalis TaxID=6523 RepID=A0AAV2HD22_LYMST